MRRLSALAVALVALAGLTSCAYYNTFYLAKKNYYRATDGLPYRTTRGDGTKNQQFQKSIELSKKLLSHYPKDKLVDDAYLLWARALLGVDDPRLTITMLEDFGSRYPGSSLEPEAKFYLGVAYRQTRKYGASVRSFDEFLTAAPKHDLVPYAQLEKSRALVALDRDQEAVAATTSVIESQPKFKLLDEVRLVRAEALLETGAHDEARLAFQELGNRATSDEQRLDFLLREADCLEKARRYDEELDLLEDAIAHERAPVSIDSLQSAQGMTQSRGAEAYGRLKIRIGTVQLLSGKHQEALASYQRVAEDYRRMPLGAEAQYRIGYAYETVIDDFDRARAEYNKVRDHGGGSAFADQAGQRLAGLERLAQYKSSAGDSVEAKAEAAFLLAELYLFQLEKPDRALEEYRKIETDFDGTPIAGKALNAQGWVLSRKLDRRAEADSAFWAVIHQYPKTEAQIAARDFLEFEGVSVPDHLIQFPEPLLAVGDTSEFAPSDSGLTPEPLLAAPPPVEPSPGAPLAGAPVPDLTPPTPGDSALRAVLPPPSAATTVTLSPQNTAQTGLRTGPAPPMTPTGSAAGNTAGSTYRPPGGATASPGTSTTMTAAPPGGAAARSAPRDTARSGTESAPRDTSRTPE